MNQVSELKAGHIVYLLQRGYSLRMVAERTGVHRNTVERYRALHIRGKNLTCPCGAKLGHQGWCKWRTQLSAKRQSWLNNTVMHGVDAGAAQSQLDDILTRRKDDKYVSQHEHVLIRKLRLIIARSKGTHTPQEWSRLVEEFGYACVRCLKTEYGISKDHIIPIYQGGSDGIENLQPLCKSCNSSKGPDSFNWVIHRRKQRQALWLFCNLLTERIQATKQLVAPRRSNLNLLK